MSRVTKTRAVESLAGALLLICALPEGVRSVRRWKSKAIAKSSLCGRAGKGIYLLPNLLTTGCLFSGFYAIVAAIDKNFAPAGIAVFVAMLFDTLDGRIARATHTESAFGKEYDSLADMVAFGVAPAIVAYQWGVVGASQNTGVPGAASAGSRPSFMPWPWRCASRASMPALPGADKRYFEGLPVLRRCGGRGIHLVLERLARARSAGPHCGICHYRLGRRSHGQ